MTRPVGDLAEASELLLAPWDLRSGVYKATSEVDYQREVWLSEASALRIECYISGVVHLTWMDYSRPSRRTALRFSKFYGEESLENPHLIPELRDFSDALLQESASPLLLEHTLRVGELVSSVYSFLELWLRCEPWARPSEEA